MVPSGQYGFLDCIEMPVRDRPRRAQRRLFNFLPRRVRRVAYGIDRFQVCAVTRAKNGTDVIQAPNIFEDCDNRYSSCALGSFRLALALLLDLGIG